MLLAGECLPVMCEPAPVVAVGVNCLSPLLVAPILQVGSLPATPCQDGR